jgi:hypothetical protein
MKSVLQFLLIFTGLSGMFGGGALLYTPDGSSLGMSLDLLAYAPFSDFFIPGLFLFTVLGLGSLLIAFSGLFRKWYYGRAARLQGIFLLLWLVIQILSIRTFSWLQVLMALIGIFLLLLPGHIKTHRI